MNCTLILFYSLSGPKHSPVTSLPFPLNDTENMADSFKGEGQQLSYSNSEVLSLQSFYYLAKHLRRETGQTPRRGQVIEWLANIWSKKRKVTIRVTPYEASFKAAFLNLSFLCCEMAITKASTSQGHWKDYTS